MYLWNNNFFSQGIRLTSLEQSNIQTHLMNIFISDTVGKDPISFGKLRNLLKFGTDNYVKYLYNNVCEISAPLVPYPFYNK